VAWLAGPAAARACPAPAEAIVLEPVAAGVWRVPAARGEPQAGNHGATVQSVLVRDGARLWLVGSGPTPAWGRALDCRIQALTGRRVTDLVNTRAAAELALGNLAFAPARRWALPDVRRAMQARCEVCRERLRARLGLAGDSLGRRSIRPPDRVVAASDRVEQGRLGPFRWLALERRPGERVLALRLDGAAIVVAQGLLWADDVPDLRELSLAGYRAALQRLAAWSEGATLLGEQGDPVGPTALRAQLDYLDALEAALRPQLEQGDAASARADLPAWRGLPGYARQHPLNVQHAWRELEDGLFR
jgi:hypothetical protein